MTPESFAPDHPKKDRVVAKTKEPVGYIITLNKQVVPDAGRGGLITNLAVAKRLRDAFVEARPELTVELFGIFPVAT